MHLLSLTLQTPAENVALDESLLDRAEAGETAGSVLRLWESPDYCVVLGRSSKAEIEVNLSECRRQRVEVLRRSSGGGTIVAGPGCLMYAVVLDLQTHPQLHAIDLAHDHVLEKMAGIVGALTPGVARDGISDLILRSTEEAPPRKFSGNALRLKRRHILYHGTLLYDFDLARVGHLLATPTRQPDYRKKRPHSVFITNLPVKRDQLVTALVGGWRADQELAEWPRQRVDALVRERYASAGDWAVISGDS